VRTVAQHRAAALALATPLPAIRVALREVDGHVLAEQLDAPWAMPRWDNSGMDGYAVRAADVSKADEQPVELRVLADLAAGSDEQPEVVEGTAARIMTGAPMPPGADAVVPVERTDGGTPVVRILSAPRRGAHVRRAGEDADEGDLVLAAGSLMGPAQIAAAASVGRDELLVHRRPVVAVLSTGSELVVPGAELRRGQIPDSNSYLLAAAVRAAGCTAVHLGSVSDDAIGLRRVLDEHAGTVDAIITSGGVSMGAYDVVKEVLAAEPRMSFVEVAMQPGKPQGLGRLTIGTPVFALPGNPVSALVSFEVFARPALLRLRGLELLDRPEMLGVVMEGWRTPPGRAQYMPVRFDAPDDGPAGAIAPLRVRPAVAGGSGSHLVAGLARAQGFAVIGAEVEEVKAGDRVRVMRVDR
jgi:molybdopterin molybdotransferase